MGSPSPSPRPLTRDDPGILTPAWAARLLIKQWPLIVATLVAIVAAVGVWTLGQQKVYRAEALLRLDPDPPTVLGRQVETMRDPMSTLYFRREFFETEFRVMRSMRVALATVRALGLNADPAFLHSKRPAAEFKAVTPEDAARVLIARLSVEPVRDSALASIRYDDTDPARCQRILSAVVRIYLEQNLEGANKLSTSAAEWLNDQLDHLRSDLEKSEEALNDFRQQHNVLTISFEDHHNNVVSELDQIDQRMAALRIQRDEYASRWDQLSKATAKGSDGFGAKQLLDSPLLGQLRETAANERTILQELQATEDEGHPHVLAAQAKLAATEKDIAAEVANIKSANLRELNAIDSELAKLAKREEQVHKQAQEIQGLESSWNQLLRAKANNEKIYGLVLERAHETDLTRMMNFNNIRVVDEVLEPKVPVSPNLPLNLAIASAVGLVFGIVLGAIRDVSDRSLKLPEDIESHLGVTCLGTLPEVRAEKRGGRRAPKPGTPVEITAAVAPDSAIAEAARALRTNLMFTSPDKPYRTLLVTSAISEEGKTTIACSLAIALAQSGLKVLVVDADLRRPRLHRVFSVSNDVGVSLVVTGMAEIDDAVRPTQVDNVSVLTSGPIPPNPAELVQSERFRDMLRALLERFDRIVIDSPPVLPVTDAAIMSQLADGVLLVTRARRTQRAAARAALRGIREGNLVGVVLNALDPRHRDYVGYKQYYYYYKYSSHDRGAQAAE